MFINLTPHTINVQNVRNEMIAIQPSGNVARVEMHEIEDCVIDDVVIMTQRPGAVTGLPPETEDEFYIVSALVRLAVPERDDVLSPGVPLRNDAGQVVGCVGLIGN